MAKLVPATLRPLLDTLLAAVTAVERDELAPMKAQAMASLAGAAVRVFQTSELEGRLRELEAATAHQSAEPPRRWGAS